MSTVSQTPAPLRPGRLPGLGFARRFALAMAAVAAILALAVGRFWREILQRAAEAHPHAPALAQVRAWPWAIQLHVAAAVGCLVLGGALMAIRKGRTFHRTAGWVWVAFLSLVVGSSLAMTSLNHGRLSVLHLFTGWALVVAPLAVIAARRHDVARHRRSMMGLFYGGFVINSFIAFIPGRAMWNLVFG